MKLISEMTVNELLDRQNVLTEATIDMYEELGPYDTDNNLNWGSYEEEILEFIDHELSIIDCMLRVHEKQHAILERNRRDGVE
jgi:hypothetical protein